MDHNDTRANGTRIDQRQSEDPSTSRPRKALRQHLPTHPQCDDGCRRPCGYSYPVGANEQAALPLVEAGRKAPLRREEGLPGVQMRSLRLSSWTSSAPQRVSLLGEFYLHGAAGRSGRQVWCLSQQSQPYQIPVGSQEVPVQPAVGADPVHVKELAAHRLRRQAARSVAPIAASQPAATSSAFMPSTFTRRRTRLRSLWSTWSRFAQSAWWLRVEAECTAVTRDPSGPRNPNAATSPARRPN